MNPFRCSHCDKLLGMIEGKAEIKCSKCKTMNAYPRTFKEFNDGMQLKEDGWVYTKGGQRMFWVAPEDMNNPQPPFWSSPSDYMLSASRTIDVDTWKDKFKVEY